MQKGQFNEINSSHWSTLVQRTDNPGYSVLSRELPVSSNEIYIIDIYLIASRLLDTKERVFIPIEVLKTSAMGSIMVISYHSCSEMSTHSAGFFRHLLFISPERALSRYNITIFCLVMCCQLQIENSSSDRQ